MKKVFVFILIGLFGVNVYAKDYASIDAYALKAPSVKSKEDMKQLVEYLTEPYHDDVEKVRSIYAWIIHNIDYDAYKGKLIENKNWKQLQSLPAQEHILKTRLGVCEDIANLYQEMGALAGLNIQTVEGEVNVPVSRRKKELSGHKWAAVKIVETWSFSDPTWGISETATPVFENVRGSRRYETEMKKRIKNKKTYEPRSARKVHDTWFLVSNDEMLKTHLPALEQWQLQDEKITKKEFLNPKSKKGKKK